MTTALTILTLLALISLGVHIAVALGLVAIGLIVISGVTIPITLAAQAAWDGIDKYALVAIPFFIFAGNIMSRGDLALVILDLIGCVVRWFRGGIALAVAVSAVFFAAVNGSSVACAVALGPAATRLMPQEGYPKQFAAALVAVCGTLGLMIPPSLTFILIGSIVGLPVSDLFIAGIVPGLLEATLLGIVTLVISRLRGYGGQTKPVDLPGFARRLPRALGAIAMPVLIIGTIYAGWFTPTEVSALAAIYAAVLVLFVYRTANLLTVWRTAKETVTQTVLIYGILLSSGLLTVVLTRLGLADELSRFMVEYQVSAFQFLLMVNLVLIVVGMFIDGVSMIVLFAPLLFPMATAAGINPLHFGVIMTALVEVATLTPPVGLNLFVMARITSLPIHSVIMGVLPFYAARVLGLILINAFPYLSLALL
ncbi:C4-dicarboxylate ABC transporter permease [Agaricicola taiwanensis]|uniref:TRAP transporter large permease protein n=1 Tax=Agaricicola taiwanensis TaxID=591372 RepID=A0A8J2VUN4_9RHOB|nr:TRAP transporter large permease [Agaricicola taiwanensis]GGE41763.1 C4-dicarboxylate ABC transporter permease [Agaricicola taiwanensis]